MSEITVSKLTNRAGTGAPDFSQGVKISGTTSTLLAPTRTEGATEPTSPSNGDTWYDTANDTYDVYINDEWKRFIGASAASSWTVTISSLSYDSVSLSIASQEGLPMSLTFNADGTKMYIIGTASDKVHQYSLSTAFDLSTASYDSVSFSTSTQEAVARSVRFNTDGTKMYIVGTGTDTVYQYSLSTAFNISTASYDSVSLSVSSQDGTPFEIGFNSDGTKMYMIGYGEDAIFQYSLSTAFDLSTGSYDSVSLSVNSQDTAASSFAFNTDGTKLYVLGATNDTVFQYSLSTGFDVSTASYDSVSYSLSSQDTVPTGIAFSADGTKMYMIGNTNDTIYQYSTGI